MSAEKDSTGFYIRESFVYNAFPAIPIEQLLEQVAGNEKTVIILRGLSGSGLEIYLGAYSI